MRVGKLSLPEELAQDLPGAVREEGWQPLPVTLPDAILAAQLPHPHRNPFDRTLAAQCQTNGFTLVTTDPFFAEAGVSTLW